MKKIRYYTDNEILKLKKNVFVIDVLRKREIKYSPVFKLWCIMMKLEFPELTCKDIFERGGFDTSFLHPDLPHRRIGFWLKCYKKFGKDYFLQDKKYYCSLEKEMPEKTKNIFLEKLLNSVLSNLEEYN